MNAVEAELEGSVARLFTRRPELWRFTVRDRTGLPDHINPTTLSGEFFIFEIGLSPRLGKRQYDEVYDDIVRAIAARSPPGPRPSGCCRARLHAGIPLATLPPNPLPHSPPPLKPSSPINLTVSPIPLSPPPPPLLPPTPPLLPLAP